MPTAPLSVSRLFEAGQGIATARHLARDFLADVRSVHGLPVSPSAVNTAELVVSELVTNARKYAPGPYLLTLVVGDGTIDITVQDGNTDLPALSAQDPSRIGQHGLEVVKAVCRNFQVHREPAGKRITATLGLSDDPAGPRA
ncbi:ATP-binding protein [Streptomyces longisporoflavus]|uniref:ATP-binding protein n=1 Tax=Streptomyces longisporoflavus TaxID=28044 RepID=UPI001E62ED85|nr:ATP-binding protein [Streptomyces longisporoflavus]